MWPTYAGVPISAEQLSHMTAAQLNEIEIHPILERLPRRYKGQDGLFVKSDFSPSTLSVDSMLCTELGCTPPYADYFRNLEYRNYDLIDDL
ncbi:hypothetical protein [Marinobacterium sp. xm-d-530]|uniref:hypothetical protein n=1 Tax=Marinobacterium sp. xm-d-530 TaxID=2497747 RepID=UPI0015685075|nr:hypothetical protein [Marinobacterium sp. xm-d-530]